MRALNEDDDDDHVLCLESRLHTLSQLVQHIMTSYIHYPPIAHQLLVCKLPSNKYIIILEAMPSLSMNMTIVVLCIATTAATSGSKCHRRRGTPTIRH